MKIIDLDIDFYTIKMKDSKNELIKSDTSDKESKREIYEIYRQIILHLKHLKLLVEKSSEKI